MTLPKTSRGAVLVEYNKPLEIQNLPLQEPQPGAMIIKVDAATICGTDVKMRKGIHQMFSRTPILMGHEYMGTILASNGRDKDANDQVVKEGDQIVFAYPWCGKCYWCTIAREPTLCENTQMYGWGPSNVPPYLTGGFSEYMYVKPECHVLKVPQGLDPKVVASSTCAFRTVLHGFERLDKIGSLNPEETVVVFGSGPVGLYALATSLVYGAGQVIVFGAPNPRLEVAKRWGATVTYNVESTTAEERKQAVMDMTNGRGTDVAIDCAGPRQAFEEALQVVRKGGRVLEIGISDHEPAQINPMAFQARMISVIGNLSGSIPHYHKALRFLDRYQDRFNFSEMISNVYPLDQINEAIASMERLEEVKPALIPAE